MRILAILILMTIGPGSPDLPKVSGILEGRNVTFTEKARENALKAILPLLGSCHSADTGTEADLKKAETGDHVRLVLEKPIPIPGEATEITEIVFTQPINTGVFWLRSGDRVLRRTKYEPAKTYAFEAWLRQAVAAD